MQAKLRREAMFAMMAMAAKPPSKTLFPVTPSASGSLHSAYSNSQDSADRSTATSNTGQPNAVATAAAAPVLEADKDVGVRADAVHMSFMAGEGVQGSLEQKVEAYRQQQAFAKHGRTAGAMVAVCEDDETGHAYDQQQQQGKTNATAAGGNNQAISNGASTAAGAHSAAVSAAEEHAVSSGSIEQKVECANSSGKSIKSPFANAPAYGSINSTEGTDSDSADDDDSPDEVWRLPMSSTVDPSMFKLNPELSVAAGALIRQLQKAGEKIAGRSRSARSSCPMY